MLNKCLTEFEEAKIFWEWSQYHYIAKNYLFSIPNGGYRNKIEARNLRITGVKSGVSDYMLAYPSRNKNGLFIELKRMDKNISRLTKEQASWLDQCIRVGYAATVAYGAAEAIKAVEEYLK